MMLYLWQFSFIYVGSKLPKSWINKVEGYFPYKLSERSKWKWSSPRFYFPTSPYSQFCEKHNSELWSIFQLIQAKLEYSVKYTFFF